MRPFPTIKQVIASLPVSPQSQYETCNASGEAYGLPIYMGGEPTPVLRTLGLCDKNLHYYVCAVLREHSWEPKYNQAGCIDQTIGGWNVTLTRRSSKLGQKLIEVKLGQSISLFGLHMLVVNVGGGAVPQCEDFVELTALVEVQRKAPLRDEQEKQLWRRLKQRRYRLDDDANLLREFPQLESYRQVLSQEQQTQRYFENLPASSVQYLEQVMSVEKELNAAIERETANLTPLHQQAQLLRQEDQRKIEEQQLEVQKQREIDTKQRIEEQKAIRLVQQAQELIEAERLQQEQSAQKEEQAKQRQQIVDMRATQYDRSAGPIPYQSADTQLRAIKYHFKQGASSHIIRDWTKYLRSQCETGLSTALSAASPPTSRGGANAGALVGGFLACRAAQLQQSCSQVLGELWVIL